MASDFHSHESSLASDSPDFLPTAEWKTLKYRSELLKRIRAFFDKREFIEVETPILSADTVIDRHLEPIAVDDLNFDAAAAGGPMWLQTSPEFAMKRLMAAGGQAIYQLARVFRQSESGAMHNPEFTMLEWYRAGNNMQSGMQLLGEFAAEFLQSGETSLRSYQQAFHQRTGVDPFTASIKNFAEISNQRSVSIPWREDHDNRDDWLNLLFAECVQPQLGQASPEIIYDWPASQSALAVVRDAPVPVAERFELFHQGIELANGYHELTDAQELLHRNRIVNQQRKNDGHRQLPEHSRLLEAMQHGLPPCAGVALGVDRLLMAMLGQESIDAVVAFPFRRA